MLALYISTFLGFNTPSQNWWRCRSWELPYGLLLVHIPQAHVLVMCFVKVFFEIICKVFLAWVPLYAKRFVHHLVCDPEKNAFPSTVIVVFSQCHSQFLLICCCHSVLVSEVDGDPVRWGLVVVPCSPWYLRRAYQVLLLLQNTLLFVVYHTRQKYFHSFGCSHFS